MNLVTTKGTLAFIISGFALTACSPLGSNISKNALRNRANFGTEQPIRNDRVSAPDVRQLFQASFQVEAISLRGRTLPQNSEERTTAQAEGAPHSPDELRLSAEQVENLIAGRPIALERIPGQSNVTKIVLGFDLSREHLDRELLSMRRGGRLVNWVKIEMNASEHLELSFLQRLENPRSHATREAHAAFLNLVQDHLTSVNIHRSPTPSLDCQSQGEENLCAD